MSAWQYLFLIALQAVVLAGVWELWQDMQRRRKRRRKKEPHNGTT